MKRIKKIYPTVFIALLFIAGAGILAYPTVSDRWNGRVQSRAVSSYNSAVTELTESDYSAYLAAAGEYNRLLGEVGMNEAFIHPESVPGYEDTLDVTGTGIMGTITIEKIGVDLPICHGTGADVLAKGAGHLEGSSLPIGGKGNHSVISAHRGLPNSRLFTDLDRLEIGDVFTLHVLGEDLYYEVDQIMTVLPDEIEELYPVGGRDLCTLMTCTPYGINTHRLLVRGHRIYPSEEEIEAIQDVEEYRSDHMWVILAVSAGLAVLLIVWLLSGVFVKISRSGKGKDDDQ